MTANHLSYSLLALLAASAAGQERADSTSSPRVAGSEGAPEAARRALADTGARQFDAVLYDESGDGRIWACGESWKASFGADGFVYIPFFGSAAPQNYPVRFKLSAVRVGGRDVPFTDAALPMRDGDRVRFDRGIVDEIYDLATDQLEQTFTIDTEHTGDVEVVIEVLSDLRENADQLGIQFGNALGHVDYGTAFVVDGASKREIQTTYVGNRLHLHVPAAMRTAGAVVIDPVIRTTSATPPLTTIRATSRPDIAYDVSNDRFLMVQEYQFSATDFDVFGEMFDGDGARIADSRTVLDFTAFSHTQPRVANLNSADRFLVVMQKFDFTPALSWPHQVVRRSVEAASPFTVGATIFVSSGDGNELLPVVGGDSGTGSRWTVVWTREFSANDSDIYYVQINADGSQAFAARGLADPGPTVLTNPQIARSNGNGLTNDPHWVVVYNHRFSPTDWDIFGASINFDGTIRQPHTAMDTSGNNDVFPHVSSPAVDWPGSGPVFMVTYERKTPTAAAIARVVNYRIGGIGTVVSATDLTQRFGIGPFWLRVDSDGCRFAVTNGVLPDRTTNQLRVATLGVVNFQFVLHESPRSLVPFLSTNTIQPLIASKRSGGGRPSDYAVAFIADNSISGINQTFVSLYAGIAPGGVSRRVTGCGTANIDLTGLPALGETFTVQTTGSGMLGLMVGTPTDVPLPFCPGCTIGVSGATTSSQFTVRVPCEHTLVGAILAMQGYSIGTGPCLGAVSLTDTLDVRFQ